MPPRNNLKEMEMDEDDSDHADSLDGGGGGGKDKLSTTTRKAQNRIAQREFRQRKQQYIRDLEAKVELLSGDKEERSELMLLLVRNLLKENKELREMIKGMAGFVGEGLGSCLPRLGLSAPQLDAILNRADTDTAYEAFTALKASKELEEANPGIPFGEIKRKPTLTTATTKRKRDSTADAGPSTGSGTRQTFDSAPNSGKSVSLNDTPEAKPIQQSNTRQSNPEQSNYADTYNYLFPDQPGNDWSRYPAAPYKPQNTQYPVSPLGSVRNLPAQSASGTPGYQESMREMYQSGGGGGGGGGGQNWMWGAFADLSGFGLTTPGPGNGLDPYANYQATGSRDLPGVSAMPDISAQDQAKLRRAVAMMLQTKGVTDGPAMTGEEIQERMNAQRELVSSFSEDEGLRRRIEPMQLIAYHINNHRVNPRAYTLPPSLRPTVHQQTIPHPYAIDGLPFPSIRDRVILLRDRIDLVEAYTAILLEMVLRGSNPTDHRDWEFSERFFHDYPQLVDEEVYSITNRWRLERGEQPLVMPNQEV